MFVFAGGSWNSI